MVGTWFQHLRRGPQYSKYPFACNKTNNNCINVTNQSEIELQNYFSILQDIDEDHSVNHSSFLYDNNRVTVTISGYSINSMIDKVAQLVLSIMIYIVRSVRLPICMLEMNVEHVFWQMDQILYKIRLLLCR